MKWLIIVIALLFTACQTPKYQLTSNCEIPKETFFEKISGVLTERNFNVVSDISIGQIKAIKFDGFYTYIWKVQFVDKKIICYCIQNSSMDFSNNYINDNSISKEYINVKESLESICKDKIIINELKREYND